MTSLKEALAAAEAAEKATAAALEAQAAAQQKVAEVRSQESRAEIKKTLGKSLEYAKEMKNFDSELQQEVKKELKAIVKVAFGEKFRITRAVKKSGVTPTTLKYNDDEVIAVIKDAGAKNESTGISRSKIESIISKKQGIEGGQFNPNTWSKRDKETIKNNDNNKNMIYWVE
jgi:DNA-directed RNA polymerase subunit F